MKINLTWDLFIIVLFVLIIAYNCVIGSSKTLRIMLGAYIATLTADGIGNLIVDFSRMIFGKIGLSPLSINGNETVIIKVILFISLVVLISTRPTFNVEFPGGLGKIKKILLTGLFSILIAAFLIASIMIFLSGGSFLSKFGINIANSNISNIYNASYLAQLVSLNYNLIFISPAIAFLAVNLIFQKGEDENEEEED